MASYVVNGGLQNIYQYGLAGNVAINQEAALYTSPTPISAASTYSSVVPDTSTSQNVQSTWSYSLTGSVLTVTQTVVFTSVAGGLYYGVALYTPIGTILTAAWAFPAGVTLGAGGTIAVVLQMTFQLCS
jgi:hypothetical protein